MHLFSSALSIISCPSHFCFSFSLSERKEQYDWVLFCKTEHLQEYLKNLVLKTSCSTLLKIIRSKKLLGPGGEGMGPKAAAERRLERMLGAEGSAEDGSVWGGNGSPATSAI
jgi:hypothetical protein